MATKKHPLSPTDELEAIMGKKKPWGEEYGESFDVPASTFSELGAAIMNWSEEHSEFDWSWISFFGVDPLVYAKAWDMIDLDSLVQEDHVFKSAEPSHLLWAGLFATTYVSKSILIHMCGCDCEDML